MTLCVHFQTFILITVKIYPSTFLLFHISTDVPVHYYTCSVYLFLFGITSTITFHTGVPTHRSTRKCIYLFTLVIFFRLTTKTYLSHLLSATVRVYSLVAPCCLPVLTSLALLGSVSGQRALSRGPLPGYKMVSKWRLQLQDSTPLPLLSQIFCTILHTAACLGCYLLFTLMPECPLAPFGQVWQQ